MRLVLLAALALSLLIFGCCGQTPLSPAPSGPGGAGTPAQGAENGTTVGNESITPPAGTGTGTQQPPPTGEGTIVDVGGSTGTGSAGVPAYSQADCATRTATCGECIAKTGCGWCKSRNGCFYGNANGPAGDVTCEQVNWATTASGCSAPVGGSTCASKTNCADCLSGSGCKWCQIGTKCVSSDSTESCSAGGWRTVSYMCYAGQ